MSDPGRVVKFSMYLKECKVYAFKKDNIKKSIKKRWMEHEKNIIESMLKEDDAGKQLDQTYSKHQDQIHGFGINYEYGSNKDVMYDGDGNKYIMDGNGLLIKVKKNEDKYETCKGEEALEKYVKHLNKG